MKGLLSIIFGVFYFTVFSQQSEYKIKQISTFNGLSNSVVSSIAQDQYGFLWIGTQDGLNRYDGYNIRVFRNDKEDSLSLSDYFIADVFFDQSANQLWVATNYGLNQYNLKTENFTRFLHETDHAGNSISNNLITRIAPSNDGNLWLGTYGNGVDKFDCKTNSVIHLTENANFPSSLRMIKVISLCEDSFSNLWIGTQGDGIIRFNQKNQKITQLKTINQVNIAAGNINSIFEDSDHNIWIGSDNGLACYNHDKDSFVIFNAQQNNPRGLTSNIVKCIFEDHNGVIWVGLQSGGICKFKISDHIIDHPDKASFDHIYESEDEYGLSYNSVTTIFEDKDQNIWIGTYSGGLNMINNTPDIFKNIRYKSNDPQSLSYRKVWGICDDKQGNLWVGTDGGGINVYDKSLKKIKVYRKQANQSGSLSDDAILLGYRDKEDNLWFGTYSGGLNQYDPIHDCFKVYKHSNIDSTTIPANDIRLVYQDKKNKLWIGTNGGGLASFNPSKQEFKTFNSNNSVLPASSIRSMIQDHKGNYWIGTYGQGVYLIDENWTKAVNFIDNEEDHKIILGSKTVFAILQDSKNRIWLGTEGGGLALFLPKEKTFKNFTENDGLANNIVRGIIEDSKGFLWITTNKGLSRFDTETQTFINFDEKDGLSSIEFNDGSVLNSNGILYFGNVNGLSIIDPLNNFETSNLEVFFTDILLFNKRVGVRNASNPESPLEQSILATNHLVFNYKQSVITFEFISFNYRNPENVEYAYMLEGIDGKWNYAGNQHSATYRNLPSGNYVFKVKSSNLNGVWGTTYKTIAITIKPPLWRTWWAKIIYYIFIFTIIYLIIRYYAQQNILKRNLLIEKMTRQHEKELNHEKLVFFTNITHEFRSPLTLILGPIEDLLRDKDINYRVKKKLLLIYRNSNRLNDLINKVLDFRKVETGLMELKISNGNIMQTIKETCFPFREIFHEKQIQFNIEHTENELNAWYDPDKLNIILNNLLSNAYKYTQNEGSVLVKTSKRINDNNENVLQIIVTDTGAGINENELPVIFDRYYRIGKQNYTSGSGIGLALTKSLVELHKGKIWVTSKIEVGTSFYVELPITKETFLPNQIVDHHPQFSGIKKDLMPNNFIPQDLVQTEKEGQKNIENEKILLVIEDNVEILEYIKDSFSDTFIVVTAVDGEIGLELAFKHIPDIIISDIMMPKVDGLEVCRQLKKNLKTCHIPIVMLTARNTLVQKQEGYEVGADSYVTKPFSSVLLKSRVQNLMHSRKMLTEHISRSILLQPDETHINLKDEQFISDAIAIIEKNMIEEGFTVEALSSELGLSYSVLYRKIKALSGFSVAEFIRSIRLKNAAQLLRTKQYTISEVAFQVGFNDMKYFRQTFKEQYKVLPSEYLKQESSE